MNQVPKSKKGSKKTAPLKKSMQPKVNGFVNEMDDVMNSSRSSFYSQSSNIDEGQAKRIKSKPFEFRATSEDPLILNEDDEVEEMRRSAMKFMDDSSKEREVQDLENFLDEIKATCNLKDKDIDERSQSQYSVSEEIKPKPMKPSPVKESKEQTPKALKEKNETMNIYKPPIMSKALVPVEPRTSEEMLDSMNSI